MGTQREFNLKKHTLSSPNIEATVIIITFNSENFIEKCLFKLLHSSVKPLEILVFDNNSNLSLGNIIKKIKKENKNTLCKIRFFESKKNLGFSKAVNRCVNIAKFEKIFLVNPDLYLERNALEEIWLFAKANSFDVILGGKIYNLEQEKIQDSVANFPRPLSLLIEFTSLRKIIDLLGLRNAHKFWDERVFDSKKPLAVSMVSGCFMYFTKEVFMRIGKFDENFFLYLEDYDFCFRVKNKASIYFVPSAKARHYGGGSSNYSKYKINQKFWDFSKRYFVKKHFGKFGYIMLLIFDIDDLCVLLKKKILHF